jgi:hypothetical protein
MTSVRDNRHSAPAQARMAAHSPRTVWLAARILGALALLAVGAVHLQQYVLLYSVIPTIGTLFVLTFVGATVLAAALLAPIERWGGPWAAAWLGLAGAAGVALAVVTFVLLEISERRPLFGFREPGYDPAAITTSQAAEVATAVLLGAYLVARFVVKAPIRRW